MEKHINEELKDYQLKVEHQVEKLRFYFAMVGVEFDFTGKIETPEEDEPLAEIFQYLIMLQDNLRNLDEENRKYIKEQESREQQLSAANQQLTAGHQQLNAANQQLRASEQQFKAANQQLRVSEQQLQAANQQLETKEQTLRNKMADLERFNKLMVGRELDMVKLKGEVNSLLEKSGEAKKYNVT